MLKQKKKASSGALSMKHKIGYGLGDAAGCMTFGIMGSTFAMYCTDALNVNTNLLGILLIIWNVWDFINDPIMGALMDRSFAKSKNPDGKFRPWIIRSAPLVFITFIALWYVPSFFDGVATVVALFILKILYEASYTMFNIPMGALLSSMSDNDKDRASLSSARGFGSGIGNVLPMLIMPPLINAFGQTESGGYAIGAALCALIGLYLSIAHYHFTEERIEVASSTEKADNIKITDILNVFRVNRPFLALCIHGVFICMMQYVGNTLINYMFSVVYNDLNLVSYGTILSMPLMIVTFVFGPMLAKKFGLERFIRYGLIIGSALYIGLFAMHIFFYVNPYVHIIISNLALGLASMSIYMQWGLVGEAIDYNEMITGKRTEGSIYGTFNLARRIGQTIGNSAAVFMLGWVGYNGNLPQQSPETVTGIKILCVLLPGLFILGSWAAFKFIWNMDDDTRARLAEFKASKKMANK